MQKWDARESPLRSVVFQLRPRAQVYVHRARWVFGMLLIVAVAGLIFCFYIPILQNQNEIERQTHERIIELKQRDLDLLDRRRDLLRDNIAERVGKIFVAVKLPGISAPLADIGIGPQGEAVIVGWDGTILTRARGGIIWTPRPVEGVTELLSAIGFGPQGEAVIVGWNGTILTRAPGGTSWTPRPVEGVTEILSGTGFGPHGEAVIVGYNGTILTRAPGETSWTPRPVERITADLYEIRFGPQGEAVIVGDNGTILTRAPGETSWTPRPVEDASAALYDTRFGPQGEAVIVGQRSTILTRARRNGMDTAPDRGCLGILHRPPIRTAGRSSDPRRGRQRDRLHLAIFPRNLSRGNRQ